MVRSHLSEAPWSSLSLCLLSLYSLSLMQGAPGGQNILVAVRSHLSEAHPLVIVVVVFVALLSLNLLLLSSLSLAQGAPARREYIGSGQVTFE